MTAVTGRRAHSFHPSHQAITTRAARARRAVNGATPADTARRSSRPPAAGGPLDERTSTPAGHRLGPGTHGVVVDRATRPASSAVLPLLVGLRVFSAPTDVAALCLRDQISVKFMHIPPRAAGSPAATGSLRACSPTMIVLVRHGRQEAYAPLHSTDARSLLYLQLASGSLTGFLPSSTTMDFVFLSLPYVR
jgi:hypothetical protein